MAKTDLNQPHFLDPEKARQYIERIRWPHGPVCPHCGVEGGHYPLNGTAHRPGLWKCADCRKQFSVTVGTVFERSKVPLHKWMQAVFYVCSSKKGISSHQLARTLGVEQRTAWFMMHRLREAMKSPAGIMGTGGGAVEVDETFIGHDQTIKPKGSKKGRGYAHKYKVVALVDRRTGQATTMVVDDLKASTLAPIVRANLAEEARLMTDEASYYTAVGREFAEHGVVNHGNDEYVRGDIHTNTVEGFFSVFKRGMKGVYQHCAKKHLHRYSVEFEFRYNHRVRLGFDDEMRADVLLSQIHGKRLTYRRPRVS